jgi:2'-5' RNA ligase
VLGGPYETQPPVSNLAVVSYPRLDSVGSRWIESVRTQHDPQARLIRAHFTLVFPVEVSPEPIIAHVTRVASAASQIRFVLRSAKAVRDVLEGRGGHVFLLPHEGSDEIASLHEQLHGAVLQSHRGGDLPFVPHVTVAADPDVARCEALAVELNASSPAVQGTIDGMDVVEITLAGVRSLLSLSLADRHNPQLLAGKEWTR